MSAQNAIKEKMPLTLGQVLTIAKDDNIRPVDVVLLEAQLQTGNSREQVLSQTLKEFDHNMEAIRVGLDDASSLLLGKTGAELFALEEPRLFDDKLIDRALMYTMAAQVGNHVVGLNPCAGTGDSCPYTGFLFAMQETGYAPAQVAEVACLMLKIGAMFRVGKITSGCNMEGFGAGAAAIAAATVQLRGGSPEDMERAMVLAISPTIAVPCTPRVMVPGLCATHIGGAILIGTLAAGLAVKTNIEVNVPIDVMLAMAAEVHPVSGRHVVPTVVEYMQPFFKRKASVEKLIDESVKQKEQQEIDATLEKAQRIAENLAKGARPITQTLGEAVVGGSSQAVGSPTNAGRIAHYLAKGTIKAVDIALYPELFARRGINVPGILMGAVFGASTADATMYKEVMQAVEAMGIAVSIHEVQEHQVQQVTLTTDEGTYMVKSLNRGGARLALADAVPSLEEARAVADKLGIVVVQA